MKGFLSRDQVAFIRQRYPVGTQVELLSMPDDPHPIPPGTRGEIQAVDDAGQLIVKWSNGRNLSLIPGVDSFRKVPEPYLNRSVKEFLEANPAVSLDLMTPGGFVHLDPEQGQKLLQGESVFGDPGVSGCARVVTAEEILPQSIHELRRNPDDPNRFFALTEFIQKETMTKGMGEMTL